MKGRIISFDFGFKKIGIATGNTVTGTAQPLGIVNAVGGNPQWHEVELIVKEWNPDQLVVGLPLLLDGSEGDMAIAARKFGNKLKNKFGLPVSWMDERLTSDEADHLLRNTIKPGKSMGQRIKNNRDGLAAELILRTYLTDNRDI